MYIYFLGPYLKIEPRDTNHKKMPAIKTINKSLYKITVPVDSNIKSIKVKANQSLKLHHCLIDIDICHNRIIVAKRGTPLIDIDIKVCPRNASNFTQKNERYIAAYEQTTIKVDARHQEHCKIIVNQTTLPEIKLFIRDDIVIRSFYNNLQIVNNDKLIAECPLYAESDIIKSKALVNPFSIDDQTEDLFTDDDPSIVILDDKHLATNDSIIATFCRLEEATIAKDILGQVFVYVAYYDHKEIYRSVMYFYDSLQKKYVVIGHHMLLTEHCSCPIRKYYKYCDTTIDQ